MAIDVEVPDVVGFSYEEATSILGNADYQIQIRFTGLPSNQQDDKKNKKIRILSQRIIGNKNIELIIGYELYSDPCLEKEVNEKWVSK